LRPAGSSDVPQQTIETTHAHDCLGQQKGGSGRARSRSDSHRRHAGRPQVRLLEPDPQGTVSNWRARRAAPEPAVEPPPARSTVEQKLRRIERSGVTLHRRHRRRHNTTMEPSSPRRIYA